MYHSRFLFLTVNIAFTFLLKKLISSSFGYLVPMFLRDFVHKHAVGITNGTGHWRIVLCVLKY